MVLYDGPCGGCGKVLQASAHGCEGCGCAMHAFCGADPQSGPTEGYGAMRICKTCQDTDADGSSDSEASGEGDSPVDDGSESEDDSEPEILKVAPAPTRTKGNADPSSSKPSGKTRGKAKAIPKPRSAANLTAYSDSEGEEEALNQKPKGSSKRKKMQSGMKAYLPKAPRKIDRFAPVQVAGVNAKRAFGDCFESAPKSNKARERKISVNPRRTR